MSAILEFIVQLIADTFIEFISGSLSPPTKKADWFFCAFVLLVTVIVIWFALR